MDLGRRTVRRERKRDAAGAGAEVEHGGLRRCVLPQRGESEFQEGLGLGPRDERVGADGDFQAEEGRAADEVLERFAFGAALHKRTEGGEFCFRQHAVVLKIKLEPGQFQDVGQEQLDLQAR